MKSNVVTDVITVRKILQLPILKDAKVISGFQGLDRVVRYVDIMEIPEIKPWLREGELLLTTAYAIRHEPNLLPKLVEDLAQAGAAALAFKPDRFIHQIPDKMIEVSNFYKLPVIAVPVGIPSIDITHSVMELVLDRQMTILRQAQEIHNKLTTMVLENRGIQAVADSVSGLLNSPVQVLDSLGEVIAVSPKNAPIESEEFLAWDIIVDKQPAGKLIVYKKQLDDMEHVFVDQARVVFSLELMRKKTAEETEKRLKGNFIDELLSELPATRHEVEKKGRQLDLDPEMLWQVGIFEGLEEKTDKQIILDLQEFLRREGQRQNIRPHMEIRGERILLFLPTRGGDKAFEWSNPLSIWVSQNSLAPKKMRLGIGKRNALWNAYQSYVEARKALNIGSRIYWEKPVIYYETIETYQILADVAENRDLSDLVQKKLGKLIIYDQEHGSDLLKTLFVYLESGCSTQDTANRLFIHRNSVKYRLERIKEIADIDLNSPRDCFAYHLCLAWYFLKE